MKPIVAYELGTLYIDGQVHRGGDIAVPKSTFNNLWDFILANSSWTDSEQVMSVHIRGGRRYIKLGRYVGTVQTKDGQVLEILPKIYKSTNYQEKDQETCRKVFLSMLRHQTAKRIISFQKANLLTQKNFPIFEIFISNYLSEVETLVLTSLSSNYNVTAENLGCLKGRLDLNKQLKNFIHRERFSVVFAKYSTNIAQNRLIVSTLNHLKKITNNPFNLSKINLLLSSLSDIPPSKNFESDYKLCLTSNRLFKRYDLIVQWSRQFLQNKGFTNFAGSSVNQSLLFNSERLFEQFIAHLFNKFAKNYSVSSQISKNFLVDKHLGNGMFKLRPDMFIKSLDLDTNECIIVDTKWKNLDSTQKLRNYLIDIKDMYQLYAYGQKYRMISNGEKHNSRFPKLVLIYPASDSFNQRLPDFIYEEIDEDLGLSLKVVPFDLSQPNTYQKQVIEILKLCSI